MPQVIHAVAILKASLEFAPDAPPGFARLAAQCMAADPKQRPAFANVTLALEALLDAAELDAKLSTVSAALACC